MRTERWASGAPAVSRGQHAANVAADAKDRQSREYARLAVEALQAGDLDQFRRYESLSKEQ